MRKLSGSGTVPSLVVGLSAIIGGFSSVGAQVIRGTVFDSSNGLPVAAAAVYLADRGGEPVSVAMADSLGHYELSVPVSGQYVLLAQRFGYADTESPLVQVSNQRDYPVDLELRPEPVVLGGITVTVQNERVIEWLRLELGVNPRGAFGFRLLQGERLAEAKAKARGNPTTALRWLYIPIQHRGDCVAINSVPRAVRGGWRRPGGQLDAPGAVPAGTRSPGESASGRAGATAGCGSLFVDDRRIPNEHIDDIDLSDIAVIVTLPGTVRMYTAGFGWAFR